MNKYEQTVRTKDGKQNQTITKHKTKNEQTKYKTIKNRGEQRTNTRKKEKQTQTRGEGASKRQTCEQEETPRQQTERKTNETAS